MPAPLPMQILLQLSIAPRFGHWHLPKVSFHERGGGLQPALDVLEPQSRSQTGAPLNRFVVPMCIQLWRSKLPANRPECARGGRCDVRQRSVQPMCRRCRSGRDAAPEDGRTPAWGVPGADLRRFGLVRSTGLKPGANETLGRERTGWFRPRSRPRKPRRTSRTRTRTMNPQIFMALCLFSPNGVEKAGWTKLSAGRVRSPSSFRLKSTGI